jgi:hypothetical protein
MHDESVQLVCELMQPEISFANLELVRNFVLQLLLRSHTFHLELIEKRKSALVTEF